MNCKTLTQSAALLLAIFLFPFSVAGVQVAEAANGQTIGEMVVTATRAEQRPIDVPVAAQLITSEEIERSGLSDVAELIARYVTGHYHKNNGLLSPIGLRGFRTDAHGDDLAGYVLILIDGHRLGTGNAAKINLDRIERVEIIKGPSSALYGSAAMGGVINLITKKGDGELGGSITAEYGSFDSSRGQISEGGEVNDNLRFFVTASLDSIDDYNDPSYGRVYNSRVDKKSIGGNLLFGPSDKHELRLGGNYADLTGESPNWVEGTYSSYDPNTLQNSDKSSGYADLEYNGDFIDDTMHWKGLAYYLWDQNHWKGGALDPDSDQTKYIDTSVGTDHQFSLETSSWNTLLSGFTLEALEKESSAISDYLPSVPYTPGLKYNNQAVFFQDSLDLLDKRVNLIAAARYDRFNVTTKRAETGAYAEFTEKNDDYDRISPKIGVGVKFFEELLRLRANIGEGFKSPTADQLAADYVHGANGVHYVGNPDLLPETSITYDFGLDFFAEPATMKIGYFHTDYTDKIVQIASVENGRNIMNYSNHGDAKLGGVEFNLEWRIDKSIPLPFQAALTSNLTFNTTKEDEETGKNLLHISDYEVKSGLDLTYGKIVTQISHVLIGPQMITNYDTNRNEEKDGFDYWDLSLRYDYNEHWKIKGSILNLLNQEVEWVRGYLMPEINYRLSLTYSF